MKNIEKYLDKLKEEAKEYCDINCITHYCKYRRRDTYMDVLYDMTMQGLIEKRIM